MSSAEEDAFTMDYLNQSVGEPLAKACAACVTDRPADPVEYIALWLERRAGRYGVARRPLLVPLYRPTLAGLHVSARKASCRMACFGARQPCAPRCLAICLLAFSQAARDCHSAIFPRPVSSRDAVIAFCRCIDVIYLTASLLHSGDFHC